MRSYGKVGLVVFIATTMSTTLAYPAEAGPSPRAAAGTVAGVSVSPATGMKAPTATGYGGTVVTVDDDATRAGLEVLRRGGNAVDAAVAAAATLGVTEPFSAGVGGGGFLVYYEAKTRKVYTVDGRETAPMTMRQDAFVNPATGKPYDFDEARVSGLSVGVPGTPALWRSALSRWGTMSLGRALQPAIQVANRGFVVDQTFVDDIVENRDVFGRFSSTQELFLPSGAPPRVGSVFRNPDLARTYRILAREGTDAFYQGEIGRDILRTVTRPPVSAHPTGDWSYPIRPGTMSSADLERYTVRMPAPTHSTYHGLDVYGMPTPSSGGTAVGEALNILAHSELSGMSRADALHHYLEASALAFADRNRYVGDHTPRSTLDALLDKGFAAGRACLIDPVRAMVKPTAPGVLGSAPTGCATAPAGQPNTQGTHTTNLTVSDRWGNVAEYTLTIEQTGGSGMVVPGRGFLLNNELTDFNFTPTQGAASDPNLPGPGKRPRSSMSPTIVLQDGRPFLAVGTPGGSTIITTVLYILVNRLDGGMTLPQAIAAPRVTQRNTATALAEPGFLAAPEATRLRAMGHVFAATSEIGAATGVEFLPDGRTLGAAEPARRGGGAAAVVFPAPDRP